MLSLLTTTRRAEPSTSRPTSRSSRPDVGVDHLAAGHDRQVLEERLAAVAEERRLDRDGLQRLADRVDHQRRQRLALDVLGDDQQRLARLGDLLQQRQQVGQRADLLAVQQHQRVLEHGLLGVEVGDEVRRQEALVEADALGDLELGVQRRGLLDGDDAVVADLGHRLADQLTDLLVARGHGGDLRDRRSCRRPGWPTASSASDTASAALPMPEPSAIGLAPAATLRSPALTMRLRQHGRGGGAVAGDVVGLGGHRLHQLGAQVLERVFQVDLAGDGDAVVGDRRAAERLGQHHVPAARAQRHPHRVGELVDAGLHCAARGFVELNLLAHRRLSSYDTHAAPEITRAYTGIAGAEHGAYLLTTASTSRADRIRYSSPLYLISVPPYLL